MQLLEFSQQLCDRLEQLLLTYATRGFLSLNESEPNRYKLTNYRFTICAICCKIYQNYLNMDKCGQQLIAFISWQEDHKFASWCFCACVDFSSSLSTDQNRVCFISLLNCPKVSHICCPSHFCSFCNCENLHFPLISSHLLTQDRLETPCPNPFGALLFTFPACLTSVWVRPSWVGWRWPFSVTASQRHTWPGPTPDSINACAGTWRGSKTRRRRRRRMETPKRT